MAVHLPLLISSAMAVSAAVGAAVAWSVRSVRRPAPEPADAAVPPARLAPTAREIGGLILVGAAATLLVVRAAVASVANLEVLCLLFLLLAVALRVFRLTRPGTPTIERLAAFLALVPGGALLIGRVVSTLGTNVPVGRLGTAAVIVGLLAATGAVLWIRRAM
jgi:hypothetical protein